MTVADFVADWVKVLLFVAVRLGVMTVARRGVADVVAAVGLRKTEIVTVRVVTTVVLRVEVVRTVRVVVVVLRCGQQ